MVKRLLTRRSKNITITIILVVVLLVWMLSGIILPSGNSDASVPDAISREQEPFSVRVTPSHAELTEREVVFYGVTEADRLVNAVSEIPGMVERLYVEEGEQVKQGQRLIKLEVKDRGALTEQARAQVKSTEIEYEAAKKLSEKGLASAMMLAERESKLQAANAGLIAARLALKRSTIDAPFDGVVERIDVEQGEFVTKTDQVLLQVVDRDPLVVRGYVTEFDVKWVKQDQPAEITLGDGRQFFGKVRFVGVVGDDVTRTFRVEIALPNEAGDIPVGVTASARLVVEQLKAHKVPASVLELDKQGRIGVKSVDEQSRIVFHPVDIVKDTTDGMWISGAPEEMALVVLGGPFVAEGETVKAVTTPQAKGQ